ncbi:unnamed protein product [Paramecium octaurelia]|uniref:Uncharacterized protein n=1 Tax=Paramecium octaurelia TaxID=43137 RepID=A0A8S1WCZ1_PAROT|nr:unnamed protein product [Paramecium octaurelia]
MRTPTYIKSSNWAPLPFRRYGRASNLSITIRVEDQCLNHIQFFPSATMDKLWNRLKMQNEGSSLLIPLKQKHCFRRGK